MAIGSSSDDGHISLGIQMRPFPAFRTCVVVTRCPVRASLQFFVVHFKRIDTEYSHVIKDKLLQYKRFKTITVVF